MTEKSEPFMDQHPIARRGAVCFVGGEETPDGPIRVGDRRAALALAARGWRVHFLWCGPAHYETRGAPWRRRASASRGWTTFPCPAPAVPPTARPAAARPFIRATWSVMHSNRCTGPIGSTPSSSRRGRPQDSGRCRPSGRGRRSRTCVWSSGWTASVSGCARRRSGGPNPTTCSSIIASGIRLRTPISGGASLRTCATRRSASCGAVCLDVSQEPPAANLAPPEVVFVDGPDSPAALDLCLDAAARLESGAPIIVLNPSRSRQVSRRIESRIKGRPHVVHCGFDRRRTLEFLRKGTGWPSSATAPKSSRRWCAIASSTACRSSPPGRAGCPAGSATPLRRALGSSMRTPWTTRWAWPPPFVPGATAPERRHGKRPGNHAPVAGVSRRRPVSHLSVPRRHRGRHVLQPRPLSPRCAGVAGRADVFRPGGARHRRRIDLRRVAPGLAGTAAALPAIPLHPPAQRRARRRAESGAARGEGRILHPCGRRQRRNPRHGGGLRPGHAERPRRVGHDLLLPGLPSFLRH